MRRAPAAAATLLFVFLALLANPASAQTDEYGGGATLDCAPCLISVGEQTTVTGTGYLPNATVTLTVDGVFWTTVVTDATGSFSLPYTATTQPADGFLTFVGTDGTNTLTTVVEVRSITVAASGLCRINAPYISWVITPINFMPEDPSTAATVSFLDASGAVVTTFENVGLTDSALWPGTAVDNSGQATEWPGWEPRNGTWVKSSDEFSFTRPVATVQVSVNPTATVTVDYPPTTPACDPNPPGTSGSTGGSLPRTGSDAGGLVRIAVVALVIGAGLVLLARRAGRRAPAAG